MVRRGVRSLTAVAFAALAVAACGESRPAGGTVGGSAASNGVSAESPDQILAAAQQAIRGARSVHVSGSLISSGQPITLDLRIASGRGGVGEMSESGLSFRLVDVDNAVYVKGSPAFWRHFGGAAAAQLFQDKWLKGPATGSFASFAALVDLPALFDRTFAGHGTLAKGAPTTVDGERAVPVRDTSQGSTVDVALTGKPYPVRISKPGNDGGTMVFDSYDQAVTLTAPQSAIDLTAIQK